MASGDQVAKIIPDDISVRFADRYLAHSGKIIFPCNNERQICIRNDHLDRISVRQSQFQYILILKETVQNILPVFSDLIILR